MSKILIFSDLHVHMHRNSLGRLNDCLRCLEWVLQSAVDRGITHVIFAGDLFQDRQKIHVSSYQYTYEILKKYCSSGSGHGLNLYILVGNHDMWFSDKWEVSSVKPLGAIDGVTIIDEPCSKEITEDFTVDFLPYTKNPVADISKYFISKSRVLVSHIAVDGAQYNTFSQHRAEVSVEHEGDMVKVDVGLFAGWERVFLGHYHCAQKLNNYVEYVGSPLQLNFGEANQKKHIIIFDTDTFHCEYLENKVSPKHLILKESQLDEYDLENNFVQVLVDDIASTDIIDLKNTLKSRKTSTLEFKEVKEKREDKLDDEQTKFDFAGGEILERYIKAVGHNDLDYDRLLAVGKSIVTEHN